MCVVTDASSPDGRSNSHQNEQGVLANLPRTRPQRSTARRVAARKGDTLTAGEHAPTRPKRAHAAAPKRSRSAPKRSAPRRQAAPRQGYETDSESASGPVQPPGAAELASSVAEILGELAKSSVSRSERLLKDLLHRLPLT
jgi:hypothetical protein